MKKHLLWFSLPLAVMACKNRPSTMELKYPATFKDSSVVDVYHGDTVPDPYRWLENDTAQDTKAWVDEENKVTQGYLAGIPFREELKKQLQKRANYSRYRGAIKAGKWVIFEKNTGLQNQNMLVIREGLEGSQRMLLDPNELSAEGLVTTSIAGISKDNKYAAISMNTAGSDWQDMFVIELATGKRMKDELHWLKFSGAEWGDDGFYYSRYPEPKGGSALSEKNEFHRVYYHRLGTLQSEDQLIYEDKEHPQRYHSAQLTHDKRWLVITASEGTDGTEVWAKDLTEQSDRFIKVFSGFKYNYYLVGNQKAKLLFLTNNGAPNYKLISVVPGLTAEPGYPGEEIVPIGTKPVAKASGVVPPVDIIPESKTLLQSVHYAAGKLFAVYLKNACSELHVFSLDGKHEKQIDLGVPGTLSEFDGDPDDPTVLYSYFSWALPNSTWAYENGAARQVFRDDVNLDGLELETEQVFYPSKDGTKIPMFLVYKKGMKRDGNNPTLLYGYGGFNISLTPSFSAMRLTFLEAGGVYAIANLRGGGELGEDWHQAGMLEKKQTVFDDFIAAAQFLIDSGFTSQARLAIMGGSNGGLLVGACMTQRPDLFKVAIPQVGVMDMLRYHKFTIGWGWAVEYGSSDDSVAYKYLKAYSPLHNIKKGVAYPATLVMTADHDDRVVPAHSFKFIATLQEAQAGNNPVLIRIEKDAGHGAGKSINKYVDEMADVFSFVFFNMNYQPEWK